MYVSEALYTVLYIVCSFAYIYKKIALICLESRLISVFFPVQADLNIVNKKNTIFTVNLEQSIDQDIK